MNHRPLIGRSLGVAELLRNADQFDSGRLTPTPIVSLATARSLHSFPQVTRNSLVSLR